MKNKKSKEIPIKIIEWLFLVKKEI